MAKVDHSAGGDDANLDVVPEGFKNNINWNIGHILVGWEHATFSNLGRSRLLPEGYHSMFPTGSSPVYWVETADSIRTQQFVLDHLNAYFANGLAVLVLKDWTLIWKCYIADLSHTTTFLSDFYSNKGPQPRDPTFMLRSYLLFLFVRPEIGLTAWVDELHRVPFYAILSGFVPGDIPGVGTFYDFLSRFWAAEAVHLKPKNKPRKQKPKRQEGRESANDFARQG